jgi:hypothetical protein
MTDSKDNLPNELRYIAKELLSVGVEGFDHSLHQAADALEAKQWQPIETAPKDGTRILLFTKMYGPSTGHWDAFNGSWVLHSVLNSEAEITHWQPLPTPPTEDE